MRVLITGITGMAGSHLAEYILGLEGVEVYGMFRPRSKMDNLEDIAAAGKLNAMIGQNITSEALLKRYARPDQVNLIEADMTDAFSMQKLIASVRPDRIFHLAAQSFVLASWHYPAQTLELNIMGQLNIFEAVRQAEIDPLIQIAGSSEEYGLVLPDEVPMRETNPLRPLSPYAVSKVTQEMLAYQYHRSYGLKTITTRGFNHTGPRRGQVFVTSDFARQVARIEKGLQPPVMMVGDLTSKRDWTDVRDMVRAYWLTLEKCTPGEVYNIGSGTTRPVQEVLDTLVSLSKARIDIRQDPARMRPSDVKILWSDPTKFQDATGWRPQIPFEKTLEDTLDYWRKRV
ncbi:MAG TPA: GDP-mannose 4,6-dehydratase [Chloroflexota bacterium]